MHNLDSHRVTAIIHLADRNRRISGKKAGSRCDGHRPELPAMLARPPLLINENFVEREALAEVAADTRRVRADDERDAKSSALAPTIRHPTRTAPEA